MYKDTLDGVQIVLTTPALDGWKSNYNSRSFYTLLGVPAGVNLSISNFSADHATQPADRNNTLILSYSGNFSSDWNLSIRVGWSAFNVREVVDATFGPIQVRAVSKNLTLIPGSATVLLPLAVTEDEAAGERAGTGVAAERDSGEQVRVRLHPGELERDGRRHAGAAGRAAGAVGADGGRGSYAYGCSSRTPTGNLVYG